MNNYLILIAGYPGTGKSYLCNMILTAYPDFISFSPDEVKEMFWDKYGFHNITEKNHLIDESWQYYYTHIEKMMCENKNIISDYPFSDKQKITLNNLCTKYSYKVITIRMIADLEILFKRQQKRDLDTSRHPGHILNCYEKNNAKNLDRQNAEGLLSHKEFIHRCSSRGYGEFSLGKLLCIDVSDFSTADYTSLMQQLQNILSK